MKRPLPGGLLEENIQRLEDIGFDCNPKKLGKPCSFEKRLEQLKAYKAKHAQSKPTRRSKETMVC